MNRAPTPVDDTVALLEGGTATIDLLANDSDPDGDDLSIDGGTSAGHGTLSFDGGIATYTADAGFVGQDSFLYVIGDGRGATAAATVRIVVRAAQEPAPATAGLAAPPATTPRPARQVPQVQPAAPRVEQVVAAPVAARGQGATRAVGARRPAQVGPAVTAPQPAAPVADAPRMGPSTAPYVAPAAGPATGPAARPATGLVSRPALLPFTGPRDALLPLGVGLVLTGGLAVLAARRETAG